MARPKVAIFKLTSCSGCQQVIVNCEDVLLDLVGAIDIRYFKEATRVEDEGPYDVAFIEGSVSMPEHIELVKEIREKSKFVVTIGACATAGGIQALRNFLKLEEAKRLVYPHPELLDILEKSTPVSEHIQVDVELRGCPINGEQFVYTVSSLLNGIKPFLPTYSLCIECKRKGNVCVMVTKGIPCLGPVVQAGCGALCPSVGRGCFGCFGPMETPHVERLKEKFAEMGLSEGDIVKTFRRFTSWAQPFREVGGGER